MEVHLGPAGDQLQDLVQVGHELGGRSRSAGIVSGGLNAAGQGFVGITVKAAHVVSLPAVQGHGDGSQLFHCRLDVHAEGFVSLFCRFVAHWSASI